MSSYPPDFNDSENSPSLFVVVPDVVFWAKTEAPNKGSFVVESTTFPVRVNWPKTIVETNIDKRKRQIFIVMHCFLKIQFLKHWSYRFYCMQVFFAGFLNAFLQWSKGKLRKSF